MSRITLKNVSSVSIGGQKPGATFKVAEESGEPAELFWRKRLAEGAVQKTGAAEKPAAPVSIAAGAEAPASEPSPPAAPVVRPATRSSKKD